MNAETAWCSIREESTIHNFPCLRFEYGHNHPCLADVGTYPAVISGQSSASFLTRVSEAMNKHYSLIFLHIQLINEQYILVYSWALSSPMNLVGSIHTVYTHRQYCSLTSIHVYENTSFFWYFQLEVFTWKSIYHVSRIWFSSEHLIVIQSTSRVSVLFSDHKPAPVGTCSGSGTRLVKFWQWAWIERR